jgi:hypothetical protein
VGVGVGFTVGPGVGAGPGFGLDVGFGVRAGLGVGEKVGARLGNTEYGGAGIGVGAPFAEVALGLALPALLLSLFDGEVVALLVPWGVASCPAATRPAGSRHGRC